MEILELYAAAKMYKMSFEERVIVEQEKEKNRLSFDVIYDPNRDKTAFPLPKRRKKLPPSESKPKKKRILFDDANGICYLCEKEIKFYSQSTIDHVVPKSRGGSNSMENCKITHSTCNNKKGNLLLSEIKIPFTD